MVGTVDIADVDLVPAADVVGGAGESEEAGVSGKAELARKMM